MTDYTKCRSIIEVLRSRIAASKADGFGVVSRVPVADLEALIDAAERTEKAQAEVTRLQSLVDEAAGVLETIHEAAFTSKGYPTIQSDAVKSAASSFLARLRQPQVPEGRT